MTVYAVVEAKRMSSAKARIAVVRRARSLSLLFLHTGGVRDGTVIGWWDGIARTPYRTRKYMEAVHSPKKMPASHQVS